MQQMMERLVVMKGRMEAQARQKELKEGIKGNPGRVKALLEGLRSRGKETTEDSVAKTENLGDVTEACP